MRKRVLFVVIMSVTRCKYRINISQKQQKTKNIYIFLLFLSLYTLSRAKMKDKICNFATKREGFMRNIPTVTKNLLIINIIAFLASLVLSTIGLDLNSWGGLHFFMASEFHVWQLLTYQFLHAGFTHILFNMFAVWMFGMVIENVWGPKKFLFYYLSCGIGAGLTQEVAQLFQFYFTMSSQMPAMSFLEVLQTGTLYASQLNGWTTIGASGAVYAILLAFGMIFPNERIFIFPLPIPIKAKWFVAFYVVVELFMAFSTSGDGVAHTAHLGGMLFGFLMIRYWNRHPDSSGNYGKGRGRQFFENIKYSYEKRQNQQRTAEKKRHAQKDTETTTNPDYEYNEKRKKNQDEIDRILSKIRTSGYDSLTPEEKKRLFDSSNDN